MRREWSERWPGRGLRNARLELHADFVAKLAVGCAFVGVARLLRLFRTFSFTGSAAGDAVIAFTMAAALGVVAWRLLARRDLADNQENS